MQRLGFMAVGGLTLGLGCIVAIEAWGGRNPATTALTARSPAPLRFNPATAAAPDRSGHWASTILAHPLFNPSRHSPVAAATGGAASNGLPRLSGIMISPTGRLAIFSPAGGKPIIAVEGSHIGRYTIHSITPDHITIEGPGGLRIVRTAFGASQRGTTNNHAAEPAAPSKQAPSLAEEPFGGALFGLKHVYRTKGGIVIGQGKPELPNAATWQGPPPLSQLPEPKRPPLASKPLLDTSSKKAVPDQ